MEYFFLVIILIVLSLFWFRAKRTENDKINAIRNAWGKPKIEHFDFDLIRRYANRSEENFSHRLSDQTVNDIDFEGVFAFIDRTTSRIGQQYLYKKTTEPGQHVDERCETLVQLLGSNQVLRERLQVQLAELNHRDAYSIVSLIGKDRMEVPAWFKYLYADLAVVLLLLVFSATYPVLLIVLILPVSVNMILHYWNKGKSLQYVRSFPQLNMLIEVSKRIVSLDSGFDSIEVRDSISRMNTFQSQSILLSLSSGGGWRDELSQVFMYLVEVLKAIFLVEVFALHQLTRAIEHRQDSIRKLFDFVGLLDSAVSIASLRAGEKKTCIPRFMARGKKMGISGMYHPLVDNCVPNNLAIDENGILITGSNMSGKSTFLRTLVINSVLAQTINTCFANEFSTPFVRQFTLIRVDDDLFEGRSYYFEEVRQMGMLLQESEKPIQHLFVLDELFKGTNTVERIASAKAILSYLNRGDNLVVASTHDIELAEMLSGHYNLFHFNESVEHQELVFDYLIKPGQLTTRNAIRILELSGYPQAVTNEARELVSRLPRKEQE